MQRAEPSTDGASRDHVPTLRISAPDRPGLVAGVAGTLFERDANILEADQYDDHGTGRFFQRLEFEVARPRLAALEQAMERLGRRLDLSWTMRDRAATRGVAVFVSTDDHWLLARRPLAPGGPRPHPRQPDDRLPVIGVAATTKRSGAGGYTVSTDPHRGEDMLQRLIGVSIGALVTFILLLVFYGTKDINGVVSPDWRIVSDSTQAFLVASVIGAIASFFWPITVAWWLHRRMKNRREDQIQSEVERQIAEQQRSDR
jgi:predicted amino acid-binding ACT domain protein